MNINKTQFEVLVFIEREGGRKLSQLAIADKTGISLGSVNKTLAELTSLGLVAVNAKKRTQITRQELEALEPYRVKKGGRAGRRFWVPYGSDHPQHARRWCVSTANGSWKRCWTP